MLIYAVFLFAVATRSLTLFNIDPHINGWDGWFSYQGSCDFIAIENDMIEVRRGCHILLSLSLSLVVLQNGRLIQRGCAT